MKKIFLSAALFCAVSAFGQLNEEKILKSVTSDALKNFTNRACECMDSISVLNKNAVDLSKEISQCIDNIVVTYQTMDKLFSVDTTKHEDQTITIYDNPESAEYRKYYNQIEKILLEDCPATRRLLGVSNIESAFSYSSNFKAIKEYNEGMKSFETRDYKTALKYFEKAVKIDEKFAFAWDNIGMCHRRLGKYDKAIEAYNKSLSIDPEGEMPMVNLPIVYELKKDNKKALEMYLIIQKRYPLHAEGYYGAGRILYMMENYEEALDQMCIAYLLYVKQQSPYRSDAEKIINLIYQTMKKQNKEDEFYKIMQKNKVQY